MRASLGALLPQIGHPHPQPSLIFPIPRVSPTISVPGLGAVNNKQGGLLHPIEAAAQSSQQRWPVRQEELAGQVERTHGLWGQEAWSGS